MISLLRILLAVSYAALPALRAQESPDQLRIASHRDNFVWLQDGAKAGARKLVEGESPSLSPDGRRIAYLVSGESDRTLHIIDCETARDTQFFTGALTGPAVWSPDGQQIAILVYDEERMGNAVHVVSMATKKRAKLALKTPAFSGSAWSLQWLPGEGGIGFHDMKTYFQAGTDGKVHLSAPLPDFAGTKNVDGRTRDSLSSSDTVAVSPADPQQLIWTEDETGSPAFAEALNGEPISALMSGRVDGSLKPRALTKKDLTVMGASWSPRGEWIFFTGYTDAQAKEGYPFRIWAVRADGSGLTMIARGSDVSVGPLPGRSEEVPAAAPDAPAASAADLAAAQKLVNEGYAMEQKGDTDAALARYERALELVPDPKLAKHMEELTSGGAEMKAQTDIAEGYQLERAGKLAEAAAKFRGALKVVKDERVAQRLARIEAKIGTPPPDIAKTEPKPIVPEAPPVPAPVRPEVKPEAPPVPEQPAPVPATAVAGTPVGAVFAAWLAQASAAGGGALQTETVSSTPEKLVVSATLGTKKTNLYFTQKSVADGKVTVLAGPKEDKGDEFVLEKRGGEWLLVSWPRGFAPPEGTRIADSGQPPAAPGMPAPEKAGAPPSPQPEKPADAAPADDNASKVQPVAAGPGMWKQVKRYSEKSEAASHVTHKHDAYGHDSEYHKPDPSAPTGEISGLLSTHFEMEDYDLLNTLKAGAEVAIGMYQSRHYSSPDDSKSRIVFVPADAKVGEFPKGSIAVLKDVELPRPYGSKQQNGTLKVPDGSAFPGGRALLRVEGVHHGEVSATTLLYEWVPEKK